MLSGFISLNSLSYLVSFSDAAFVFSLAIRIGVARVAGDRGCFLCIWGSRAHEGLQGSLPDIKCETGVDIVFFFSTKNENFEL